MLVRHIIGYTPSLIVPGLTAFAAVFFYTRLLSATEYGYYALTINSMNLLNMVFFFWLQMALPRLMPRAAREGRATAFRATTYVAYVCVSSFLLVATGLFAWIAPQGNFYQVAVLAVPLALTRSLLSMNQAFHRSALDFNRYNVIECGQAVAGLALGLGMVWFLHLGYLGAVGGMTIGMTVMTLVDIRTILHTPLQHFDRAIFMDIVRFGTPLIVSFGLDFVISSSDRYLIDYYQGAAQVGIYAAGFTLIDRITSILFMAVAVPSLPLTIHKLEHEGVEAARDQTYKNGVAILALSLPAFAGLILTNGQLANTLIGADFRAGALRVMPWIAVASILSGIAGHYFGHAFHLAQKPHLFLFTEGPTAALNLGMNLFLIPRLGYMGAAYAAVASRVLLVILNIAVGRRVFAIKFPFKPALQIAAATGLLAVSLSVIPFPENMYGLAGQVGLGVFVYSAGLVAFDVMNIRGHIGAEYRRLLGKFDI
jgi:O-antigen/teichoic acid export membrane protein